jgi:hypothetical protein
MKSLLNALKVLELMTELHGMSLPDILQSGFEAFPLLLEITRKKWKEVTDSAAFQQALTEGK